MIGILLKKIPYLSSNLTEYICIHTPVCRSCFILVIIIENKMIHPTKHFEQNTTYHPKINTLSCAATTTTGRPQSTPKDLCLPTTVTVVRKDY